MRWLRRVAALSAAATIAIFTWAAMSKVRIDSRAELETGEGQLRHGLETASVDALASAGRSFTRAMSSYVPFDRSARRAGGRLVEVMVELSGRGETAVAVELGTTSLEALDRTTWLFAPLGAERVHIRNAVQSLMRASPAGDAGE